MQHSPRRLALIIGIDHYRHFPANPLVGCVNDALAVEALLREKFHFETFKRLLNEQATESGITSAFQCLLARSNPGDEIVIFYAGHGSQRLEEGQRLVETIVPHDSGRGSDENRDIPDKALFAWLRQLTAKPTQVTLLFDSCHSAGIGRLEPGALPAGARLLPSDFRSPSQQNRPLRVLPPANREPPVGCYLPPGERFTLLAACRADEVACEMRDLPTPHGAFSYFLCQELGRLDSARSYRQVFENLAVAVTRRFPHQHPQIEGAWDRRLFFAETLASFRFVAIKERRASGQLVLSAGAATGVVVGSEWEVFQPGQRELPPRGEPSLGRLQVDRVDAVEALASILDEKEPGAIGPLARAVESSRPDEEWRLPVVLGDQDPELAAKITQSPLLRVVGPQPDLWAYQVERREPMPLGASPFRDGAPRQDLPAWQISAPPGQPISFPTRPITPGAAQLILEDLEKIARHRALSELENLEPQNRLRDAIQLSLFRKTRFEDWHEVGTEGEMPIFEVGDQLAIEVRNNSLSPLACAVIGLGAGGAIEVHHPPRGSQHPLAPGENLSIGRDESDAMVVCLPQTVRGEGLEIIKAIATSEPCDFGVFSQQSIHRDVVLSFASPLERRLAQVMGANVYRETAKLHLNLGDWTTCQKAFRLRRQRG